MAADPVSNPILNSPYDPPAHHFELGPDGPTGVVLEGRRPSESFIPLPASQKAKGQLTLDFDATGERRERNTLINDVRYDVDRWRARGYPDVTPATRKLLLYWAGTPPDRDEPMFFCQREAAETIVFMAEAAGRRGWADYRTRIDLENALHNAGLSRTGVKMATGAGKTVVIAMIIAWQTINKVLNPRDARFAKRFLVVTPGITIKDRLRVLDPADPGNYYRERDLVPADLWDALVQAQVVITNYHAMMLRDTREIQGIASNTRKILAAGKAADPFRETKEQMVNRVLRNLAGRGKGEVVVLNDEAHHCYQDRPLSDPEEVSSEDKLEVEQRNADARVWFKGLQAVGSAAGIKAIYDLSATPFYLRGSGYLEGYIFPWVVSDFSLMDAIESGIVKVPRIPVDDDAQGDIVTYLRLWDYVGGRLPKRKTRQLEEEADWVPPRELQGALESLYRSYERRFATWEEELRSLGETPPVMIVVCPNTLVSKLVYDWIAGTDVELSDGSSSAKPGELRLLSNVVDGMWTSRPRTILIDSAQLESGEVMGRDFKQAASHEIETFFDEYRRRNPGADIEQLTDEDLLREVMNTVGKRGRLGEHIRCVVSVSMLTEGWDANTVTHILGIRRFGSQLLCEQVVGRGLRRRSYAINDEGRLDPEYAEIYGVPFAFIPGRPAKESPPRPPAVEVFAIPERSDLRIVFPKVDGYRREIPDAVMHAQFGDSNRLHLSQSTVATWTKTQGIVGGSDEQILDRYRHAREQEVAYRIARLLVRETFTAHDDVSRPWLFPQLVDISRDWLRTCLTVDPETSVGMLLLQEGTHLAVEKIERAEWTIDGDRQAMILPIMRPFDPIGSTDDVHFQSRKVVIPTTRSHVNRVVLDGPKGNTWEQAVAGLLEGHNEVAAYVKNDHLDFSIPYVFEGHTYNYFPDFLARLHGEDSNDLRTLIIEVSGGRKSAHSPGPVEAKAATATHQWCPAVNNHGGFGIWAFVEVDKLATAAAVIEEAIQRLRLQPGPSPQLTRKAQP